MDYLDSGLKIAQTVLPQAFQYIGKTKEREAKLTQAQDDLAQSRAENEVLVMKNYELKQANAEAAQMNEKLSQANMNLEAFRNIVMVLIAIALVAYVGTRLVPQAA